MSRPDRDTFWVAGLLIIALATMAVEMVWPWGMANSIQELVRGG